MEESNKVAPVTELALLPVSERAAVVMKRDEHRANLLALVAKSADIVAVIDVDGRTQCHRMAMDLKNARCAITNAGEEARKDAVAFSKAVIEEAATLIKISTPEEDRLFKLRDDFDTKVREEAAAKARAEKERVDAIQARIQALRHAPLAIVGKSSSVIAEAISALAATEITEALYGELIFHGQAMAAKADAIRAMETGYAIAKESEQAAEDARLAAEERERQLVAQAAENARVAAELKVQQEAQAEANRVAAEAAAVEAKRVADEFAATQARALAEAAEASRIMREGIERARVEQERIAAENAAAARLLADRQAEFEAKLAAQAQADADRKEALRLEAEHEELNKVRAENIAALIRMEDPSATVVVTSYPIASTASGLAMLQCEDATEQIEAFRAATRALLAVRSVYQVMNLMDEIIEAEAAQMGLM